MSYLCKEITNLPNTLEGNANRTVIPLNEGRIDRVDLCYPDGCVGLLRCKVYLHGIQIIPFNLNESIGYNNHILELPMQLVIDTAPFELQVFTWNLDNTYTHTLTIGIVITYQNDIPNPIIDASVPITVKDDK
jgi:hypothetical protein